MIGTGAALKHFDETGKQYPLVVKLGTITPQVCLCIFVYIAHSTCVTPTYIPMQQGADVYSYAPDEDCMVTDPQLAQHLAHWGIDAMK